MVSVSVIVLIHNSEKTLSRCLNSLLKQDYSDFELVLVDDCSTDNSLKIIGSYNDKRIQLVHNPKNFGIAKGRNIGIKNSQGNLIFFTDSDCIPALNWLKEGIKTLGDNDIVTGWTLYENPLPTFKDRVVFGKDNFFTCNLGFKRSALEKVGGFDEQLSMYGEDKDICFRILKTGGRKVFCETMQVIHQTTTRRPRDELRRYTNYYLGKLNCHLRHVKEKDVIFRIVRPDDLAKIIFPPLFLLTKSFTSWNDFKLLPFTWLGMIRGRIRMWGEGIKTGKFYW